MEFKGEVRVGNRNLGVTSMELAFIATGLNQINHLKNKTS